jgi:hypothetical protein
MAGYIYRSAITGRFVSKAYAEQNPDTTYAVRRKQSTKEETA